MTFNSSIFGLKLLAKSFESEQILEFGFGSLGHSGSALRLVIMKSPSETQSLVLVEQISHKRASNFLEDLHIQGITIPAQPLPSNHQ